MERYLLCSWRKDTGLWLDDTSSSYYSSTEYVEGEEAVKTECPSSEFTGVFFMWRAEQSESLDWNLSSRSMCQLGLRHSKVNPGPGLARLRRHDPFVDPR